MEDDGSEEDDGDYHGGDYYDFYDNKYDEESVYSQGVKFSMCLAFSFGRFALQSHPLQSD